MATAKSETSEFGKLNLLLFNQQMDFKPAIQHHNMGALFRHGSSSNKSEVKEIFNNSQLYGQ